ncbi:MAG: type II secretion system protein [Pseudomonadota bacterium]
MVRVPFKYSRGFTVLETLVALSIGLIAFLAFTGVLTSANKLTKKSLSTVDISSLKRTIYATVNCDKTFSGLTIGNPCSGSSRYIDLRNADGQTVVSANGTISGNYAVRAYCSDGANRGLDVRAVKLKPAFLSNVQDISWIGLSSPTNPTHYMPDESRSSVLNYDWNHPNSILSTPGISGLCAASFQTAPATTVCSNPNEYVQSIDFDAKLPICKQMPFCGSYESLEFSGTDFYCSSQAYWNMVNNLNNYTDSVVPGGYTSVNNYRDKINNYEDYVYNRFSQLASWSNGTTTSVGGSNDTECAKLDNGSCPDGYLMYGYEARQQGNGGCRASCVKIAPP